MKICLGMMRNRDLSQNHRFFGEFTGKNKSFGFGVERYSEIGFNWRPLKGQMCEGVRGEISWN